MSMPIALRARERNTQAPTTAVTPFTRRRGHRRFIVLLLILSAALTFGYVAISVYAALIVESQPPVPVTQTPAAFGLHYRDVTFYSRIDHVRLRGWFIPGVLPNGHLTLKRTLIVVHGTGSNRASPLVLGVSAGLAREGFAVLAFDLRGMGQSDPAPLSEGYFEQRDVLGAVDFLRTGALPYAELGRPRIIGAWGDSMGAATILLAAAREPAIRAIVSDSGFAAIVPVLQSDSTIPGIFLPGVLQAVRLLYSIDYYATRPVDVVARLAPRPLFFIQGSADSVVPPSNLQMLAAAAEAGPHAHVRVWQVKGADHIASFHVMGAIYMQRVVAFFTQALGPDTSQAA